MALSRQQPQSSTYMAPIGMAQVSKGSSLSGVTLPSVPRLPAYDVTPLTGSPLHGGIKPMDYRQKTPRSTSQQAAQSHVQPHVPSGPAVQAHLLPQPSPLPRQNPRYQPETGKFDVLPKTEGQPPASVLLSGPFANLGPYSRAQMDPELIVTLQIRRHLLKAAVAQPEAKTSVQPESSIGSHRESKHKEAQGDSKPAARRILVHPTIKTKPAARGEPALYSPQGKYEHMGRNFSG